MNSESAACFLAVSYFAAATSDSVEVLTEGDASEEKENSSASEDASDTDVEARSDTEAANSEVAEEVVTLSNETREKLCLKAEPSQPTDIPLHPVLVIEWTEWMRKDLYEEEETKLRKEIMKKFPKKGNLNAEASKLNPEILAYMSGVAKNRDKHFVSSQNALGSAMIAVAKSISLILELEGGEISRLLLQLLGNAGKLLPSLHYQHSIMRRSFILQGIDEKYRFCLDLLKKSDISNDLFGNELFKRLKHTKSLGKVVEDLTPRKPRSL